MIKANYYTISTINIARGIKVFLVVVVRVAACNAILKKNKNKNYNHRRITKIWKCQCSKVWRGLC